MKKSDLVREVQAANEAVTMKLPFKSVDISTILHATEDEEKVSQALSLLLPEDVSLEREEAEGHYGDSKVILSASIENRPHMRKFWDKVLELLSESERDWLSRNAVDRIADDCTLYLRFDKQFLVGEERLKFTKSGDIVHVRMNVSAYPAKKELAVEKMREFVEAGLDYD